MLSSPMSGALPERGGSEQLVRLFDSEPTGMHVLEQRSAAILTIAAASFTATDMHLYAAVARWFV